MASQQLVGDAPAGRKKATPKSFTIPETPWAGAYKSTLLTDIIKGQADSNQVFSHLNCCYFSTPGRPPTLGALKKHAQGLAALIKLVGVSTKPGVPNSQTESGVDANGDPKGKPKRKIPASITTGVPRDDTEMADAPATNGSAPATTGGQEATASGALPPAENAADSQAVVPRPSAGPVTAPADNGAVRTVVPLTDPFHPGQPFDWLNNLTKPYEAPSEDHDLPLTGVLNRRMKKTEDGEELDHCPLYELADKTENEYAMPYATYEALIEHANEALEVLDHELTAAGGLLSILPPLDQPEARDMSQKTLLGQLVLFVQQLVAQNHELTRSYASACDVLAGEAIVPAQIMSDLGGEGRAARMPVYPQDRFVLANAGEDVFQWLDQQLTQKEAQDERYRQEFAEEHGRNADVMYARTSEGKEFTKGIVSLDVVTRYYRAKNGPKTIFVVPASEKHPQTKKTRDLEGQPTVVSVNKPVYPARVSEWEKKRRAEIDALREATKEGRKYQEKIESVQAELEVWKSEAQRTDAANKQLRYQLLQDEAADQNKQELGAERVRVQRAIDDASRQERLVTQRTKDLAAREKAVEAKEKQLKTQEETLTRKEQQQKEWVEKNAKDPASGTVEEEEDDDAEPIL